LRATANLSTGGIAVDRTDDIHPETVWLAQRVAKNYWFDIAELISLHQILAAPLREMDGVT